MIMRYLPLGALMLSGLLACATGSRGPKAELLVYDFGPSAVQEGKGVLVEVSVPVWLNTTAIGYRLLYRDAHELREYAYARWAGLPSQLIQQHLRQRWSGAKRVGEACTVKVQVTDFTQHFFTSDRSEAFVQAEVSVTHRASKRSMARVVRVHEPARTADARGGVQALVKALDRGADEMSVWVDKEANLADCRLLEAK